MADDLHEDNQPMTSQLSPQAYWITNDPSADTIKRCADVYGVEVMPYSSLFGGHREGVLRYLRRLHTHCSGGGEGGEGVGGGGEEERVSTECR